MEISLKQARALALRAQGLDRPSAFGKGKKGALAALTHLGYVQIDTISVVARAHHHVLWSRVPDYNAEMLHELQTIDPQVFEYWSHAAAFLPLSHYRYSIPRMLSIAAGKKHWFARDHRTMKYVFERIRAEGPLQARDFEAPKGKRPGNWFEWKPAKTALEQLFMQGELMIRERKGFQKVFDLKERVLPSWVDTTVPTEHEKAYYLIESTLRSQGIAQASEMHYLRRGYKVGIEKILKEEVESANLLKLKIAELPGVYYSKKENFEARCKSAKRGPVFILSPFDNSVIQRKRLQTLFNYDYQVECYVPEPKRKFGYFCLPLLWGDQFIGRMDAKAARVTGVLKVHRIFLEAPFKEWKEVELELRTALTHFAAFNKCDQVRVEEVRVTGRKSGPWQKGLIFKL